MNIGGDKYSLFVLKNSFNFLLKILTFLILFILFSKFVASIQHENIRKIVDILVTGPSRSWALTLDPS